jgi:hypothetical protein
MSNKRRVIIFSIIFVILFSSFSLALDMSQPWHTFRKLSNPAGRIFDDQARAYKCDSISLPTSVFDVGMINHPLQQFSDVDSNNNGWPDIGISLLTPENQTPVDSAQAYHDISEVRRGVAGAANQKIDSNNNGWPDYCDCVLSEVATDPNNCGACGNVCSGSNPGCCSETCVDLSNDESNCGSCGNQCGSGQICKNGVCGIAICQTFCSRWKGHVWWVSNPSSACSSYGYPGSGRCYCQFASSKCPAYLNVWEWVNAPYGYYPAGDRDDAGLCCWPG